MSFWGWSPFQLPPSSLYYFCTRRKLSWESKLSHSFSNGHRVQCSFNLSRCALWGEVRQILAATLTGPAEPWPPLGPAAPLPMRAETSLPPAQLTPMAPGVACCQHFKGDSRTGCGVGGQPSPKLSLAANTSSGKSSSLSGSEEKQCYTGWALCALDRDIEFLLSIRYQIGNRQDWLLSGFLWECCSAAAIQKLWCAGRFSPAPACLRCCQMSPGFVTRSRPLSPPSAASPSAHLLVIESCQKIASQSFCFCVFPSWFPAASCYECQTPAFPMKRPNKAFIGAISYSAAFNILFSWPFEWIKKLSDICTWGKSQRLSLYANSACL